MILHAPWIKFQLKRNKIQIDIEISEIFLVIMVLKTKGPLKKHKYEIFISLLVNLFNLKLSKRWFMRLNQFWLIIVTQTIKVTMIIETSLCEIGPLVVMATTILDVDQLAFLLNGMEQYFL
jgi:hypothetical protein